MRRAPTLLAAALLSVGLSGCVSSSNFARPALDLPDRYRFNDREAAELANARWWEQFDDPALRELIESGLRNNLDVRIATARVEEFYGALGATRSNQFMQTGVDAMAGRNQVPTGIKSDQFQTDVFASWELDVFGRLRHLSAAARADLLASEEGRRFAVLSLVSAVAGGYVRLRTLDSQLDIARRTEVSRGAALQIFQARNLRGAISELELSQAQSEYLSAVVTIPRLELQQAQAENALAVLVGRNPGPIQRAKTLDQLVLPTVPAGLPSEILERRPDVRQAELNLVAANTRVGAAKTLYFPSISLTGILGTASNAIDSLFSGPAKLSSYAATITAPVFTGGGIKGQIRAAEARREQVLLAYRSAVQGAFQDVDDALIADKKSREELAGQGQRVEALQNYARLARRRFDSGYSGYLEVLDAERSLFGAELDYTRVKSETYLALINLYKALGGGWVTAADAMAPQPKVSLTSDPLPLP